MARIRKTAPAAEVMPPALDGLTEEEAVAEAEATETAAPEENLDATEAQVDAAVEAEKAEEEKPKTTRAPRKVATKAKPQTTEPLASKKLPPIDSLFSSLEDSKEFLRLLFWGREGSGKTTAALTLSQEGRVLVINAEGGLKKKALASHGVDVSNVVVYPRPGEALTYEGMDALHRLLQADLQKDPNSWAGVVIDSATDVVQRLVDSVSDERVDKLRAKGTQVSTVDSFFTDRSDYGSMSKMFRDLLRKYRDLQAHLVVTALERRDVDEDSGRVVYGPAVTPGIQGDLLGYVDAVLYFREADDEKPYYRAATKRAGKFRSKDRFGSLPPVLVNPTAVRVLGYVEEELNEATDPEQEALNVKTEEAEPEKPKATRTRAPRKAAGS